MKKAAVKHERKLWTAKEGTLLSECWESIKKKGREAEQQGKGGISKKQGWSMEELTRKMEERKPVWLELEERRKDLEESKK